MKPILLILILLSILTEGRSQHWFQERGHSFKLTANDGWVSMQNAVTYENRGEMHSEYLTLFPDFRFVFIGHYEIALRFSTGYWKKVGDNKIVADSDELLSEEIIRNEKRWTSYGLRKEPRYLPLKDWILLKAEDSLITTVFDGNTDSLVSIINAFVQSIDFSKCIIITDTIENYDPSGYVIGHRLRDIYYDQHGVPVKYETLGLNEARKDDRMGIFFIPGDLGFVKWNYKEAGRDCSSYFIGQNLIFTDKLESTWLEYDNWRTSLQTATERYKEDHAPSLRGWFRNKQ